MALVTITNIPTTTVGMFARVCLDTEWEEYIVRFYKDGKHIKSADYHTEDEADAIATAKAELTGSMGATLDEAAL